MIGSLGKGIFWWRTNAIAGGDPVANGRLLEAAGFQWVAVKVADSNEAYTPPGWSKPNVTKEFIEAFREVFKGKVFGWDYVTAIGARQPGSALGAQVLSLGLDGGILDVEETFDLADDAEALARTIVAHYRLRTAKPLGWCSWGLFRNPRTGGEWHPANVAKAGMEGSDFGMPMAYWPGSLPAEVAVYAGEVIRQWRTLVTTKPLVLTGRGWTGDGGTALPSCIRAFDERVRAQDMAHDAAGISWWSYQHAVAIPRIWNALKGTPGWVLTPPQPPPAPPGVALREWAAAITLHLRKSGYTGPDLTSE
jgi:hypothetical protein